MARAIEAAPITINVDLDGHQPSLSVVGKANKSNINNIVSVIDRLIGENVSCISLDLSGLESIDTAALTKLAHSADTLRHQQKRFHLSSASREVKDTFDQYNFSSIFCPASDCRNCRRPHDCCFATETWAVDVFTLPSAMSNCQEARNRVDSIAERVGFCKNSRSDIMLAVGEAVSNAIRHGSKDKDCTSFTVSCVATTEKLSVSISDNGPGFNPAELPAPIESLFLEHGRGIRCMKAVMDEVSFSFNSGTTVRLVKLR